jgi:hypothetical protein
LELASEESFNKTVYSGDIYTNNGRFGGSANYWTIGENDLYATYETAGNLYFRAGKTSFSDTTNGWILGIDAGVPKFLMGGATDSILMSAGNITITGAISATSGTVGGWNINSTSIYTGTEDHSGYTANSGDITLYSNGTDASIHAYNWYIDTTGVLTCKGAVIDGTSTLGGRLGSTLASAINSSGNFIDVNLDTSAKNILKDFAFASTDYSGALKCGTITWNATTGAITGGTGGVFHKGGIVFAVAGVATITLDAATGNATFAGTLAAASGTLGAFTVGTNAYHVDSSGNMWWGTSATYAGATYKISASGVAALSTTTAVTMTSATVRSNDGAAGTRIDITDSDTAIKIRDANTDILFIAQGETFTNAVCEIRPYTNDKRALYLYTSLATATVPTQTILSDGANRCLYINATKTANTESMVYLSNATAGYSLETASGKGIKVTTTGGYAFEISSSYAGTSILIDETATTGAGQGILYQSARPCNGVLIDMTHTTNTYPGLRVNYDGDGTAAYGIVHIEAHKAGNICACLGLRQMSDGGAHINFYGDPSNSSPNDGDMWFTGAELYMKIGATVYKFDKTAV